MITKQQVQNLIQDKLEENDCFVVELEIRDGNAISLEIDSLKGITVQDCMSFSRAVEHNLDREVEDFELQVSSPGLDKPFRVKKQYQKNIGRKVKVVPVEGIVVKGELIEVNEKDIVIEFSYKERIEGRKKKQTITKQEKINFNNIKETTIIISFK
ncbi:MAG: ribosome assembly cofactor RimP [Flavobacteriales bacterium]|nr:MAG: ribosome assembly cofactor RimP [Flavobacteriales bacterium]